MNIGDKLRRGINPKTGLLGKTSGYQGSLIGANGTGADTVTDIQDQRALSQSGATAMGNSIVRLGANILGDVMGAGANVASMWRDEASYNDTVWDIMKSAGEDIKRSTAENFEILSTSDDKGLQWSDAVNPKFWANTVEQFGPTIAMMAVSMGAAGIASKGLLSAMKTVNPNMAKNIAKAEEVLAKGLDGTAEGISAVDKLNKYKRISNTVSATAISRSIESGMEATQAYDQIRETLKADGRSEEEARALAAQGASDVYKANWALAALDLAQFDMIYNNPISKNALGKVPKGLRGLGAYGTQMATEGAEEGIQYAFTTEAEAEAVGRETDIMKDYFSNDEFWESVVQGALGGVVFQGIGDIANKFLGQKKEAENKKEQLEEDKKILSNPNSTKEEREGLKRKYAASNSTVEEYEQYSDLRTSAKEDQIEVDIIEKNIKDPAIRPYIGKVAKDAINNRRVGQDTMQNANISKKSLYEKIKKEEKEKGNEVSDAQLELKFYETALAEAKLSNNTELVEVYNNKIEKLSIEELELLDLNSYDHTFKNIASDYNEGYKRLTKAATKITKIAKDPDAYYAEKQKLKAEKEQEQKEFENIFDNELIKQVSENLNETEKVTFENLITELSSFKTYTNEQIINQSKKLLPEFFEKVKAAKASLQGNSAGSIATAKEEAIKLGAELKDLKNLENTKTDKERQEILDQVLNKSIKFQNEEEYNAYIENYIQTEALIGSDGEVKLLGKEDYNQMTTSIDVVTEEDSNKLKYVDGKPAVPKVKENSLPPNEAKFHREWRDKNSAEITEAYLEHQPDNGEYGWSYTSEEGINNKLRDQFVLVYYRDKNSNNKGSNKDGRPNRVILGKASTSSYSKSTSKSIHNLDDLKQRVLNGTSVKLKTKASKGRLNINKNVNNDISTGFVGKTKEKDGNLVIEIPNVIKTAQGYEYTDNPKSVVTITTKYSKAFSNMFFQVIPSGDTFAVVPLRRKTVGESKTVKDKVESILKNAKAKQAKEGGTVVIKELPEFVQIDLNVLIGVDKNNKFYIMKDNNILKGGVSESEMLDSLSKKGVNLKWDMLNTKSKGKNRNTALSDYMYNNVNQNYPLFAKRFKIGEILEEKAKSLTTETSKVKFNQDPDLLKIDQDIIDARNGDVVKQKQFEDYGIDWKKTTTYRFVGQSEVDVLLNNEKVQSQREDADVGIDVTSSPKVTTASSATHRVTFKESFDKNNGLGKVKAKNENDSNLEKGKGYDLNDVQKIEVLDKNGNVVQTIYEASNTQTTDIEAKKVYHHTSVSPQNFNFGNFKRGKNQVSQFGDGLNAATETNEFFTKRYGQPIEGEVNDRDFVEIDANLSESEIYDYLIGLGYKINTPQYKSKKYNFKSAKEEYDNTEPANDSPSVINLFNDFQQSNPEVKGVKVVNHIIGNSKVAPFYVIYDAKSFYGPGSLSKQPAQQTSEVEAKKTDIEKRRQEELGKITDGTSTTAVNTKLLEAEYDKSKKMLLEATNDMDFVESKYKKSFIEYVPYRIEQLKSTVGNLLVDQRNPEAKEYTALKQAIEENKINAKYDKELDDLKPTTLTNPLDKVKQKLKSLKAQILEGVAGKDKSKTLRDNEEYQKLLAERKAIEKEANKILSASELNSQDVEDIDVFIKWASENLPSYISIADIDTLGNNLKDGGVRVGAFVLGLNHIAGGQNVSGTIYTGANSPFKYHEAFHGIYRMLLTDKEINNYRRIARKEVRTKLRAEGKNFKQELERFRNSADTYTNMTETELENQYYEEYLADEFEKFKISPKNTNTDAAVKSLFTRILEWIQAVFSSYNKNELQTLFENIDAGKFKGAQIANNQFTTSLNVGATIEANAIIPYNSEFSRDETKLGYIYLDSNIADPLVRSISAMFLQRISELTESYNPKEQLDLVMDDFTWLYDLENPNNENKTEIQKEKLGYIQSAFENYSTEIKEEVVKFVNQISDKADLEEFAIEEFEDETGLRTTSEYDKDASMIGGFRSLSSQLRGYIATTTVEASDYFGNTELKDGEPLIIAVNFTEAYNGLLKSVKNLTNPKEILQSMYFFGQDNAQAGAVVRRMLNDIGISVEQLIGDNTIPLEIQSPLLMQSILKGFENFRVDYLFNERDNLGNTIVYSASERDDINSQLDRWSQGFISMRQQLLSNPKRKDELIDLLADIQTEIIPTDKSISNTKLRKLSKLYSKELFNLSGIKLSPLYIQYSMLYNRSKLQSDQKAFLNINKNETPLTHDVDGTMFKESSISIFSQIIQSNNDIFDTGEQGMDSRLKTMAISNAPFDETIGASVFKNPNGDLVYAHQLPTYHLKMIAELNKQGKLEELINSDPYLKNNFLLNSAAFKKLSQQSRLQITRVAGNKVGDILSSEEDLNNNLKKVKQTSTYGDFTPQEFAINLINNYAALLNNKSYKVSTVESLDDEGNKTLSALAPILIRVMEASNTGDLISLPVIKTVEMVDGEAKLTAEAVDIYIDKIRTEFARINRAAIESTSVQEDIVGYNNKGGRAFKFFNSGTLMSAELQESLINRAIQAGNAGKIITLEDALAGTVTVAQQTSEVGVKEDKLIIEAREYSNIIKYEIEPGSTIAAKGKFVITLQRPISLYNKETKDYDIPGWSSEQVTIDGKNIFTSESEAKKAAKKARLVLNKEHLQFPLKDLTLNEKAQKTTLEKLVKEYISKGSAQTIPLEGFATTFNTQEEAQEAVTQLQKDYKNYLKEQDSLEALKYMISYKLMKEPQPAQQTSEVKLEPSDKIVWGHPGLGKTTFKESNPENILDFDTDFKPTIARDLGLPKNKQNSKGLNEWRKNNSEEAFKVEMRKAWKKAVSESKKTGKMLLVSDMMFLRENESDFDKVITTSKETFIERATKRGDNTKGLDSWKSNIDKTLSNVDSSKVVSTNKYFSEIQQTSEVTNEVSGMTALRDNVVDNLENSFAEFEQLINELQIEDQISNQVKSGPIIAAGVSRNKLVQSASLLNMNDNYKHNLKQIFFNDNINTYSINEILLGDQAVSLKDAVDQVKRAKMQNGAYYSAYSAISAPKFGVIHPVEDISLVALEEPEDNGIDIADAQMYMTTKAFRYMWFGFGKLTAAQAELIDRIETLENITPDSIFGNEQNPQGYAQTQSLLNSKKLVYGDGSTFLKMSAFTLTPGYTSTWNSDLKMWLAKPGMETLHNLRVKLEAIEKEKETIAIAAPLSAIKMKKQRVNSLEELQDTKPFTNGYTTLDARFMGLQQLNPSNKLEQVDPTQIKQILTSEQDDSQFVPALNMNIGQIKEAYNNAISQRVSIKFKDKRNLIFTFDGAMDEITLSKEQSNVTPKLAAFLQYALSGLKASQSSSQILEFFSMTDGVQNYNLNNQITVRKFEQLFLTYFSKGVFSERTPGLGLTLVSDFGNKIYRRVFEIEDGVPVRSEVLRRGAFKGDPNDLFDIGSLTQSNIGAEGVIVLDRLRHGVMEYDSNGKPTGQRYTEMMMPAHHLSVAKLIQDLPNEAMPDVISKMFAVRIPSQDNHSAMNIKWVDFMPSYYGSSAMFARELIEVSGADFDIDKVFAQFKDFYVKDNEFYEYGNKNSLEENYSDYVRYVNDKVNKSGTVYSEAFLTYDENLDGAKLENSATKLEAEKFYNLLNSLNIVTDAGLAEKSLKALQILGLPITKEEYGEYVKKHGEPYEAPLNNKILDYKYALLGNDAVASGVNPISYSPATLDILQTTLKTLAEESKLFEDRMLEDNIDVDNLVGKIKAFKANKGASIGAAVLPNLYLSLLTEYGIDLKTPIVLNGVTYDSFKYTKENKDKSNQRKQDTISSLITMATDNAKERLFSKLGLNKHALGIVTMMTSLSIPIKTSILLINNPVIQDLYSKALNKKDKFDPGIEKLVSLKIDEIIFQNREVNLKGVSLPVTDKLLLESIDFPEEVSDLENISILSKFKELITLGSFTEKMGAPTSLTKVLGKDMAVVMKKKQDIAVLLDVDAPLDLNKIYNSNTWNSTYVNLFNELTENLLPETFLSGSPVFQEILNDVIDNVDSRSSALQSEDIQNISLDLLSYLNIKGYQYNLLQNGTLNEKTISNELIYPGSNRSIVDVVDNIKTTLESKNETNFFIDNFVTSLSADAVDNNSGLNLAVANTFRNLSALQKIDLQSGFAKLFGSLDTKDDAQTILNYIMVKDGLQVGYQSLLEAIAPFTLNRFLSHINTVEEAVRGDVSFESVFGLSKNELTKEFIEGFLESNINGSMLWTFERSAVTGGLKAGVSVADNVTTVNWNTIGLERDATPNYVRIKDILGKIRTYKLDKESKKYNEIDTYGSNQQTSIGFMFGPRPTYKEIRNFVKAKNGQNQGDPSDLSNLIDDVLAIQEEVLKAENVNINATESKVEVEFNPEAGSVNIADTASLLEQLGLNQDAQDKPGKEAEVIDNVDASLLLKNGVQLTLDFEMELEEEFPTLTNFWDANIQGNKKAMTKLRENNILSLDDFIEEYNKGIYKSEESFLDQIKKCNL